MWVRVFFTTQSIAMNNETISAKPAPTRKVKGRIEIDIQRCKGCELCINACKEKAIALSGNINIKGYRYAVANNDLCNGCVNCALVCPDAVINVYRTRPDKKKENVTPVDIREQLRTIAQIN
jgi:2-oxoglutarate ferredoxin oxidoreductase subunit delta